MFLCTAHTHCSVSHQEITEITKAVPQNSWSDRSKVTYVTNWASRWTRTSSKDTVFLWKGLSLSIHSMGSTWLRFLYSLILPRCSTRGSVPYFPNNIHISFWRLSINFLRRVWRIGVFLNLIKGVFENCIATSLYLQHSSKMSRVYCSPFAAGKDHQTCGGLLGEINSWLLFCFVFSRELWTL